MARYVTKPRSFDEDDWIETPLLGTSMTVIEEEDEPERTGLFDAHGNELYRVRERIRFGFVKE